MFKPRRQALQNRNFTLPAPTGGLDAASPIMAMPQRNAVIMENFRPTTEGLSFREGSTTHVTGFLENVDSLHVHSAIDGTETLWATTDSGVYNATTAGAIGAAAVSLTDGKTVSTMIATGAGNYLMVVNGADTLKQYDGTTWSSIATFGATATSVYSYIETYRQRLYLVKRQSLEIEYLAANSIAGAATNYPLGALFRQGGYIVALGTWTLDGGVGPEDHLAVITNKGEVAVFAGSDPATWALRGVFALGRPLGLRPTFKFGGDLLIITENGVYPLSSALQSAAIERTQAVTEAIREIFTEAARLFPTNEGWQIVSNPQAPYLLVNIPSTPTRKQAVMHLQTGAWTLYSGWEARCFQRMGSRMFFGTATNIQEITGASDNGANIVCTLLQAYNKFGNPRNKRIQLAKPYIISDGGYSYTMGVAPDFQTVPSTTALTPSGAVDAALWGTGIFGTAVWSGSQDILQAWQTLPDSYSLWKGFYLQISSNDANIQYLGTDFLLTDAGNF